MKPIRIQRKRLKGWKMTENTVYVGRPTKWGNPIKIIADKIYILDRLAIKGFDKWIFVCDGKNLDYAVWLYSLFFRDTQEWVNYESLFRYHYLFEEWWEHFRSLDLSELKGKNLSCFCKIGCACHADFLLKITNE